MNGSSGRFPLKGESGKLSYLIQTKSDEGDFAIMHTGGSGLVDEDDGLPYYDAWMDWQDAEGNEREEGGR